MQLRAIGMTFHVGQKVVNEVEGADKRIIAELKAAIQRRPFNPNHKLGQMYFDFEVGRVVWFADMGEAST
jgi:hypothetical protein